MADLVKDNSAAKMQLDQKKADLKAAYIKAREKAFDDHPELLRTAIPEYTEGMNLTEAFKTLSYATGGKGNANPGVRQRSSLDRIAPDAPESIISGRPVVSNAQHREKARAIGRKVSGETLKGTVINGSNAAFDSPEYAAAAQPGGLREQERDAELPAIQKAVFGSPASKDYKATEPNSSVGTGTPAVAGQGFYDTPYGRISARKANPGEVFTPADLHRTSLIEGLENMGITYNSKSPYGSKDNPRYRGAFEGSQKSEYNKNKDTTDPDERKMLGYTEENDGNNYSYHGPAGEGPQNKVTNPTMENNNQLLDQLRKKYPLIFELGTEQNKAYVADFQKANPDYKDLNDDDKLTAKIKHMSGIGDGEDDPRYAETPPASPPGTGPVTPTTKNPK